MPLSGGYFYPGVHVPNSSYKSLDLRGLGAAPDTAGGIGRIYVMSGSGDLFYKDPDGNEIFLGSEISSSAGYVTGSTNFFVTNTLTVSGTVKNGTGNLILSSSAGSVVALSASEDFTNSDKPYHIRSVNDKLILSSSAGSVVYISGNLQASGSGHTVTGSLNLFDGIDERSIGPYHIRSLNNSLILSSSANSAVYISGNLQASGSHTFTGSVSVNDNLSLTLDGQYNIRNSVSHLVLSSSVGSIIALSSSLDFPNTDKPYHIRAVNNHLILSSSAGSIVAASGNLKATDGYVYLGTNGSLFYNGTFFINAGVNYGAFTLRQGLITHPASGDQYSIKDTSQHLILSSSAGSVIALSASQDFPNSDKPYHIRAVNNHLILSSSTGSVIRASGALGAIDLTTATLPANAVILSGAIVWDSTTKTVKIYGPEGWCPILTGTAG